MARKFLRMGLTRRLLIYSAATLLVAFVLLEAVRHLIFGLPEEFLVGHLLYVAGFALLLLGSLFLQRGLARRFLVYGAGMLLVTLALLEVVQRLAFGLPKEFLLRHLLYVACTRARAFFW